MYILKLECKSCMTSKILLTVVFAMHGFEVSWFGCDFFILINFLLISWNCVLSNLHPLLLLPNLYAQWCGLWSGRALHVPVLFGTLPTSLPHLPKVIALFPSLHSSILWSTKIFSFHALILPFLATCLTLPLTCYLMWLGVLCYVDSSVFGVHELPIVAPKLPSTMLRAIFNFEIFSLFPTAMHVISTFSNYL